MKHSPHFQNPFGWERIKLRILDYKTIRYHKAEDLFRLSRPDKLEGSFLAILYPKHL